MQRFDFDETASNFSEMSTRAQVTLMYKLVGMMTPMVLRTVIRYCCKRLDSINNNLPDTHPKKEEYLAKARRRPTPDAPGVQTIREGGFTFKLTNLPRW